MASIRDERDSIEDERFSWIMFLTIITSTIRIKSRGQNIHALVSFLPTYNCRSRELVTVFSRRRYLQINLVMSDGVDSFKTTSKVDAAPSNLS
jgi:hypothetical protein